MNNDAPIGVFDSGIGGLTIVKEIRRLMPAENIIYVGDTARVPYGSRPAKEIITFMRQILAFLQAEKVKMAVIACNTMTAYGYEKAANQYPFTIVPMNSGVLAAIKKYGGKNVGVIATEGTVKNEMHAKSARLIEGGVKVYAKACPAFVPLIEAGHVVGSDIEEAAKSYVGYFQDKHIDFLILGCTHYPLVADVINKYLPQGVKLVNPAEATAQDAFTQLKEMSLLNDSTKQGRLRACFSGDLSKVRAMAQLVLHEENIEIEQKKFSC